MSAGVHDELRRRSVRSVVCDCPHVGQRFVHAEQRVLLSLDEQGRCRDRIDDMLVHGRTALEILVRRMRPVRIRHAGRQIETVVRGVVRQDLNVLVYRHAVEPDDRHVRVRAAGDRTEIAGILAGGI